MNMHVLVLLIQHDVPVRCSRLPKQRAGVALDCHRDRDRLRQHQADRVHHEFARDIKMRPSLLHRKLQLCPGDVQTAAHVRVLPRPALHPQRSNSHSVVGLLLDRHSSCAGARHPRSAHRAHHHHAAVGRHQQTAEVILRLLAFDALSFQSRGITLACRVSYIKSVDVWMFTCMIFVFGALIEYCVVNVLARKRKVCKQYPVKSTLPVVL